MKSVILLGDSIRMGYQPVVAVKLRGEYEVWGPGDNGRTTQYTLENLDEWAIARPADIVHINCGLHDLAREEGGAPRVDIESYESNVRAILSRLKKETSARVIWATTTPVVDEWHQQG